MSPFLVAIGTVLLGCVFLQLSRARAGAKYSLSNIRGPKSPSWIWGNTIQLLLSASYGEFEFAWLKKFGAVYKIKAPFGEEQLVVADPFAMHHILNSPNFDHAPTVSLKQLALLFGDDSVEVVRSGNEQHRRLRNGLSGGFTASVVQSFEGIFEQVAQEVSNTLVSRSGSSVELAELLADATLSAVTQALIGRPLQGLGPEFLKANSEFVELSEQSSKGSIFIQTILNHLPSRAVDWFLASGLGGTDVLNRGRESARAVGRAVIAEKLAVDGQETEGSSDVYSILLSGFKAKTLTAEELSAQTPVLLVAGHHTTANTLAMCLISLAYHPECQDRLREEIDNRSAGTTYNDMPYLNAVIKETLRLYPAVALADRIPYQDEVLPLWQPIIGRDGKEIREIPVKKGQLLTVAAASYQRIAELWGHDAEMFNPDRWLTDGCTAANNTVVGPYGNLMSFIVGPRTCIGWRFAVMEMQIILTELVGKVRFSIPPGSEPAARMAINLVPTNLAENDGKKQAMLLVEKLES